MKENKGLSLIVLVITIIVLLILAGIALNFAIGENGILTKATTVEEDFNKSEVIEELNILVTEKYLVAYNEASAASDVNNINNYYSAEKVINFLLGDTDNDGTVDSKQYIENLEGFNNQPEDTRYFVLIDSLGRKIDKYGKGINNYNTSNDYFYLKVTKDENGNILDIKVFYKNLSNEEQEIGDLVIEQKL